MKTDFSRCCISRLVLLALSAFMLFSLFVTRVSAQDIELTPRIVGGSVVAEGQYPFMASIYFDSDGNGSFYPGCGGSLIAGDWVLTAAHCVYDAETGQTERSSRVAVIVGVNDLSSDDKELILSRNIVVHPDYDPQTNQADIALIQLSSVADSDVIAIPSPLSTVPVVDEIAVVAGWGDTSEGGDPSADLLEVALPVLSHVQCLPFYPQSLDVEANVCAGGALTGGTDSCQGDSGGPLFVIRDGVYVQAGLVSYGEGCARPGVPGVYTRVTSYSDWVSGIVTDAVVITSDPSADTTEDQVGTLVIPLLTVDTPLEERMDSILSGEVLLYEVTGSFRYELTSLTGDADLFIFQGTTFTEEDIVCFSLNEEPLDSCVADETTDRLFAAVFGYVDSTFSIEVLAPADDDVVVDPDIPVVPEPDPEETDPVVDPAPDDGSEVPVVPDTTGDSDSGSGSAGYWLLLLLAGFRWRRTRFDRQAS